MRIGIPTETRWEEKRIVLAPAGVDSLIRSGHTVYIQSGAGTTSHFSDEEYREVGATIVYSKEEAFGRAEMIVKVSPLTEEEADLLVDNQILFSFLLLTMAKKNILEKLLQKKITAIGYELIEKDSRLPILHSMSEIAGPLSIQVAER